MSKRIARYAGLGVATAMAVGTAGLTASAAYAAAGTVSFSQHTGTDTSTFSVTASAACSGGTNVAVNLSGGAFPAGFAAVPSASQSIYGTAPSGGLVIPLTNTMAAYAQTAGISLAAGTYTFDIICKNAFGATVFDDFAGSITFTDAHTWNDGVAQSTPTTSTLAGNPASPVNTGAPVAFTATVSPATATGAFQFSVDGVATGAPVTVAGGTATYSTAFATAGTHQVTAAFVPSGAFGASTTAPVSYTVNQAPAQNTTTALAVSPSGTAQQFSPVTLSATVAPAGAAGKVQFLDGATPIGSPVAVDATGAASLTVSNLGLGTHNLTAAFTPTNATAFNASASAAVAIAITAPTIAPATETITTTVVPGALTISVPDGQVTLPSPTLDSAGDLFTTSGSLKPVTVTDNRAGNPGWTVNGQVSDFSDGAAHAINGENLGWQPNVVDHAAGQTITLGGVVAPGNAAAGDNGTAGLKSQHALAIAAPGAGLGTAHLAAGLNLNVPTSTVAGTYSATLTLTAI